MHGDHEDWGLMQIVIERIQDDDSSDILNSSSADQLFYPPCALHWKRNRRKVTNEDDFHKC